MKRATRTRATDTAGARPRASGVGRAAIAVAGLIGTWIAFAIAVSGITRVGNPAVALKMVGAESIALAGQADQSFLSRPTNPPAAGRQLALAALRLQALNPRALRVLALYASAEGHTSTADKLMRLAQQQSRREAAVQFWMIETAVQRGDINAALVHYDLALTTQPNTYTTLFPILVSALDDRQIRRALSPYIRARRGWTQAFLVHAVANSTSLPALVDLFALSGAVREHDVPSTQALALLKRLVDERQFDAARKLFGLMPQAKATRLLDAGFDNHDRRGTFGSIGWQTTSEADSGSGFAGSKNGATVMSIFASGSTAATVARRLLYLRPGAYRFAVQTELAPGSENGSIRWEMRCANGDAERPVWQVEGKYHNTETTVVVPTGCAPQYLAVVATSGSGASGIEVSVAGVSLTPVRGNPRDIRSPLRP